MQDTHIIVVVNTSTLTSKLCCCESYFNFILYMLKQVYCHRFTGSIEEANLSMRSQACEQTTKFSIMLILQDLKSTTNWHSRRQVQRNTQLAHILDTRRWFTIYQVKVMCSLTLARAYVTIRGVIIALARLGLITQVFLPTRTTKMGSNVVANCTNVRDRERETTRRRRMRDLCHIPNT